MAAPYNNLRSKLNRAVVAYLVSAGCGSEADVLPFHTRELKNVQNQEANTTVRARTGRPRVEMSGDYDVMLQITVRGSAVQEVGDDTETARLAFDDRVARTFDAMMQSENGYDLNYTAQLITDSGRGLAVSDPVNNADMYDFTVLSIKDGGFGDANPNEQECLWEEVLMFEVCCCAGNLGGYSTTDS